MNLLETAQIICPYCGEIIECVIDCSIAEQSYIEDCQVCCRPIELMIGVDEAGMPHVEARHENE